MEDKSSSTLRAFTVFVDAEGNDKWIADGVFVDKPKLKTDVKPEGVNASLIQEILNAAGLNKKGIVLWDLGVNISGTQSVEITVGYFDDNYGCTSGHRKKVINVHG